MGKLKRFVDGYLKNNCIESKIFRVDEDNIFDFEQAELIKYFPLPHARFSTNPPKILADPFLFVKNDELFLFYEYQNSFDKGIIMMTKSSDLENWSEPVAVLKEPFHLSFPFVFEDNGSVYMIPETGGDSSVTLYESVNEDLTGWKMKRKILTGEKYVDSSIIVKDGVYYLFTSRQYKDSVELDIYYSDSLDKEFVLHPDSPVCTGNDKGRNGGAVFRFDNKLYRPAQNSQRFYGEKLGIWNISELTKESYRETVLNDDVLTGKHFKIGGHHYCIVCFKNNCIVSADCNIRRYNLIVTIKKIINRLR